MRLANKVALVTGAASGIGRAIAVRLAQEGAQVTVVDLNAAGGEETVAQIRATGGEALFVHADVADEADVQRAIDATVETFGGLHVLVNNAAWMAGFQTATETSVEEWDRALAVDLKGPFLFCKYALPHLVAAGGGAVVNIASVGGLVGFAGYAAYCSAKGGLIQLTRSVAIDYGPQGVRANAICPGYIDTPGVAEATADQEALRPVLANYTVLGRLGRPEEVAAAALFLASDEASYVTGTTLCVDGGWTVR